jgi:hypothetical protein
LAGFFFTADWVFDFFAFLAAYFEEAFFDFFADVFASCATCLADFCLRFFAAVFFGAIGAGTASGAIAASPTSICSFVCSANASSLVSWVGITALLAASPMPQSAYHH